MQVFGLTIEDWASLLGLMATICGGIFYLFRMIILRPLNEQNRDLSEAVKSLAHEVHVNREHEDWEHKAIDSKLHEHEVTLARHDEALKTLFKGEEE